MSNSVDSVSLPEIRANVRNVHIIGLRRTRDDFIREQVRSLFQVSTFDDLINEVGNIKTLLANDLRMFKNVQALIDTSPSLLIETQRPRVWMSSDGESPISKRPGTDADYDVVLVVAEHSRMTGAVQMFVDTVGSLLFKVGANFPNTFGRSETITLDTAFGAHKNGQKTISVNAPLSAKFSTTRVHASLSQFNRDCWWQNAISNEQTASVGVQHHFRESDIKHEWTYQFGLRNVLPTQQATLAVRESCGDSLKHALSHTVEYDSRDSQLLPSRGFLLKNQLELAQVAPAGTRIRYLKETLTASLCASAFRNAVSVELNAQGGTIVSLPGGESEAHRDGLLLDRFYIGGPPNLRGFSLFGVDAGRQSNEVTRCGGTSFWLLGAHCYAAVPFLTALRDVLRTHVFAVAGNLGDVAWRDEGRVDALRQLATDCRVSVGLGVAAKFAGVMRLELNYAMPIRRFAADRAAPGFQFGIGVQFV